MSSRTIVRAPRADDEAMWRQLWMQYVAFYNDEVPEAATARTWERMLTGEEEFIGRLAECEGTVCGFAVLVLHAGSWTVQPVCYLEDLFVAEAARGTGAGWALMDDVMALAHTNGWSRVYWHTREGNTAARRLYDRYVAADDFVRYRIVLDER